MPRLRGEWDRSMAHERHGRVTPKADTAQLGSGIQTSGLPVAKMMYTTTTFINDETRSGPRARGGEPQSSLATGLRQRVLSNIQTASKRVARVFRDLGNGGQLLCSDRRQLHKLSPPSRFCRARSMQQPGRSMVLHGRIH